MYQQELARDGNALFKIRGSYLYTVIAVGVVIAYLTQARGPFADPAANTVWFWVSLAVASAGALIRIVTSGFAALGTSGNTKKGAVAAELNTTGPYSLVRNPLYLGRILNFTGIAMLSGSWVFGALTFLLTIIVYERISMYEEQFLIRTFGDAHARWAAQVPALWPRLHGWVTPRHPFWIKRAFWRENKKIFWLATAILLFDLARRQFDLDALPADRTWYYLYGLLLIGELIVRALRHFTRLFDGLS